MGRYVDRQRCYVCSSRCLLPLPPISSSSSSSSFSSSTHGVNAFLTVLLLAVVVIVATNFRHRNCGTGSPSPATGEPLAVAAGTHATGGRWRSAAVLSNSQSVVSLVCVCALVELSVHASIINSATINIRHRNHRAKDQRRSG